MQDKTYTPAVKRLEAVPEVFTGSDLTILFGWTSQTASTYLANWRRSGLVKSLGGRSDVHMNLVRNRHINPELALRRVFPMATKVGADILREAGWTTQILSEPEVAVPQPGPLYAVNGFELTGRNERWFQKTAAGVEDVAGGIRRLKPAWALADMIARVLDKRVRDAWLLAPDDLEIEEAGSDVEMPLALTAFDLDPDYVTLQGYGRLYDEIAPGDGGSERGSRRRSSES